MAPSASPGVSNGHSKARTGAGAAKVDSYHASSTEQAFHDEHEYAAHNYHPLPVVFAKAKGVRVWDPEVNIRSLVGAWHAQLSGWSHNLGHSAPASEI
jgi:acetylornithine/succinyldiaminopimelate/putrescine aminotransferase